LRIQVADLRKRDGIADFSIAFQQRLQLSFKNIPAVSFEDQGRTGRLGIGID
jgi:hypothetical protein